MDWCKFNPERLRAVVIDIREHAVGHENTENYLSGMGQRMGQAGLALDLLCIAGIRMNTEWTMAKDEFKNRGPEDFENDRVLVDNERRVRVNIIPIMKGVIKPGGRIVLVDSDLRLPRPPRNSCDIDDMSLVM